MIMTTILMKYHCFYNSNEDVCDICKGPLFGTGLRVIRPVSKLFSVKYLPLMFRACTQGCLNNFQTMSQETLHAVFYGE
uniref:Uncharacterized protein n=1 Tax=Arion vulgaris TaxID=1028688 RepID=A0A0B7A954_9EUPU